MLQSILSLMLAAVQVLAWNAAPVYLCLEADGSACVDRGPAFCDCCQSGEQSHADHECGNSACPEDACPENACPENACPENACPENSGLALSEGPCGCEHEQISDAQAAVKNQDRSGFELTACPLVVATLTEVVIISGSSELLAATGEPSSSSALAARAGVVLRI